MTKLFYTTMLAVGSGVAADKVQPICPCRML